MDVITKPGDMTTWSNSHIVSGKKIALVPTMGCFHEGHLSLMREAAKNADLVVTSLFVNPMQFGPSEDFGRYPRTFNEDKEAAAANGVDVLFAPETTDLYPDGFQSFLQVNNITKCLCGASRPGHFDGVTTVVAKLFNMVKPHVAVFGQKDFQQLSVIKRMVKDFNWDVDIVGHPIVREHDGLAMSSRNKYLNSDERKAALCLYKSLGAAQHSVAVGQINCEDLIDDAVRNIKSEPLAQIDYISIIDSFSLCAQKTVVSSSVMALAVKIGETRLIDNGYLMPEES